MNKRIECRIDHADSQVYYSSSQFNIQPGQPEVLVRRTSLCQFRCFSSNFRDFIYSKPGVFRRIRFFQRGRPVHPEGIVPVLIQQVVIHLGVIRKRRRLLLVLKIFRTTKNFAEKNAIFLFFYKVVVLSAPVHHGLVLAETEILFKKAYFCGYSFGAGVFINNTFPNFGNPVSPLDRSQSRSNSVRESS